MTRRVSSATFIYVATIDGSLQFEIKQSRPFRNRREEVALAVLRTADHLRSVVTVALQPFGLTMQQYNVLRILRGAGERGLPTLSIADRMIERTPGITRLLDRIEQQGWACRERCTKDRRVVYAHITDAGRELLEAIESPLQSATEASIPVFDEDEIRNLLQLLARMRQATASMSTPANSRHAGTK
ncbi:MAG: MarR family transcriptional regulator [Bryobacterales bacterium]|nr:MarR family transcriptional regulator [Bryobacterales bacterium]